MENYRTIVALAKIKDLRKAGDYAGAYELVKDIAIKRVRDVSDLNMITDVCTESGDFERSIESCEKVYKKNGSKHALSSLVYLNIKNKNAEKAREYLEDFEKKAPKDPTRLIYKYRIEKLEKAPYSDRIKTLEAWKREEYTERWALELAKLYHKAGDDEACVEECNCIINWFDEGEYVDWATALKAHLEGEIDLRNATEEDIRKSATTRERDGVTEYIPDVGETTFINDVRTAAERLPSDTKPYETVEPEQLQEAYEEDGTTEAKAYAYEAAPDDTDNVAEQTEPKDLSFTAELAMAVAAVQAEEAGDGAEQKAKETVAEEPAKQDTKRVPVIEDEPTKPVPTEEVAEAEKVEEKPVSGNKNKKRKKNKKGAKQNENVQLELDALAAGAEETTQKAEETVKEAAKETAEDVQKAVKTVEEAVETAAAADEAAEDSPLYSDTIERPDRDLSETGEFEIEAVKDFMQYLEENSAATVKLREEREPVTEICGSLGKALKDGSVELEDFFGNYARIEAVRKQLIRSMNVLFDKAKRGGSMIITGGPKTGKTTLAKKIAKTLNKFGVTSSKKALIASAEKLNTVSLSAQQDKLVGCAVIVEHAEKLSKDTVRDIIDFSAKHAEDSLVFLEGDRVGINELMRVYPEIGSTFNNRIHLPSEYGLDELKGFIYEYFVSNEYELEKTADNRLEEKLEKIMSMKPESPIDAAMAIAKSAVESAEARNAEVLAQMMRNGKIENADIMTIKAEDIK